MHSQPLTILHVEDNPDHADLVRRCFQKSQIANVVHLIEDGETALDYLFRRGNYHNPQSSPTPRFVLLDLRLPKLDGLEVLRTIKTTEKLLKIPVVILTSSEAKEDIDQSYQNHANSYLVKPTDFERFAEMIEHLGHIWLDWNRCPWPSESAAEARRANVGCNSQHSATPDTLSDSVAVGAIGNIRQEKTSMI